MLSCWNPPKLLPGIKQYPGSGTHEDTGLCRCQLLDGLVAHIHMVVETSIRHHIVVFVRHNVVKRPQINLGSPLVLQQKSFQPLIRFHPNGAFVLVFDGGSLSLFAELIIIIPVRTLHTPQAAYITLHLIP